MSLTFLSYVSRSGSTFLARLISQRYDVLVVPETQSPYWLLSMKPGTILPAQEVREILDRDRQLDWPVTVPEHDHDIPSVLQLIVDGYAQQVGATRGAAMMKLGSIHRLASSVLQHVPDAGFLCVIRDGRAVINSQLRSDSPYLPGMKLEYGDVYAASKAWVSDTGKQLALAQERSRAVVVRYEEVLSDEDAVLERVAETFGWGPLPQEQRMESFAVREQERQIHQHIHSPAMRERVEGWRQEMPAADRIVVDAIAADRLTELGYPPEPAGSLARRRALSQAYGRHLFTRTKAAGMRARRLRDPHEVLLKVRYALARRRG